MSLYPPEGAHWWSASDHEHVRTTVARLGAKRVLEFGPGTSTLALIEGGATFIDCCEDSPHYFKRYCHALEDVYPEIVHMRPYQWKALPHILGVHDQRYDLALIDGPKAVEQRYAVIGYAIERCDHVVVPLEEDENGAGILRAIVDKFAYLYHRPVEIAFTGPLAGSFALIGPPFVDNADLTQPTARVRLGGKSS